MSDRLRGRELVDCVASAPSHLVVHFLLGHHAKCVFPPHGTNVSSSHVSIPAVNKNVADTNAIPDVSLTVCR